MAKLKAVAEIIPAGDFPVVSAENVQYNDRRLSEYLIGSVITPESYGAVGDGITDDTAAIQKMFNEVRSGNIKFSPKVGYSVKSGLTVYSGYATLNVELGNIIYNGVSSDKAIITVKRDLTADDYGRGGVKLYGGYLNCNKKAGCGIRIEDAFHTCITNVKIANYMKYGIDNGPQNTTGVEPISSQTIITGCYIDNWDNDDIGAAIRLYHTDNNIDNVVTNRGKYSVEIVFGGNFFSNCHFTVGTAAPAQASDAKYTFIYNATTEQGANQTNSFSNCYFNGHRAKYLIENKVDNTINTILNGCSLILGATTVEYTTYIRNHNYSPIQINDINVRHSAKNHIIGWLYLPTTGVVEKSKITLGSSIASNQDNFDVVNLSDNTIQVVNSGSLALPAKTMRRIARVCEAGPLYSMAKINLVYNGRAEIEISASNNNISYSYVTGNTLDNIKIYKDAVSHVETLTNGEEVRCFDVYIYNDSDADLKNQTYAYSRNDTYPYSQVFIHKGTEKDSSSPSFANLAEITDRSADEIGENLIKYPYSRENGFESYGITYTYDTDGVVTINGTATDISRFSTNLNSGEFYGLEDGETYTVTAEVENGFCGIRLLEILSDSTENDVVDFSKLSGKATKTFVYEKSENADAFNVQLVIYPEYGKITNAKVRVMLEKGVVAHEYQAYTVSRNAIRNKLDNAVLVKKNTDKSLSVEGNAVKIVDWTKNLLVKKVSYQVSGTTAQGFSLSKSNSCLAYSVILKPNTNYSFAKNVAIGDKFRLVVSPEPLTLESSKPARQVINKDDTNVYQISFNSGENIYAYFTLDKGSNTLEAGDCEEILVEGNYEEITYIPGKGYNITVCGRNIANPFSNAWKKTISSNLTVDINDNDQTATITYTGTGGNFVPTSSDDKSEWIDIRNLVGKTIYCYINFMSGSISKKWIGVRLLHKDADGNNITIGSSQSVYLSKATDTFGFYEIGSYAITQDIIDAGAVFLEPGLWVSSGNQYTDAKFKLMFALESGLTAVEKYQGRNVYPVFNDTLPFEIKTFSPITNILSLGNITTLIGENEQGNYLVTLPDKVSVTDLTKGHVINCLGDSITYGYIDASTRANPTWCETVAKNLNCTVNNYGVNATAICEGSSESFVTRLERMTETDVDCLVIFGGTNDYGNKHATEIGNINDDPAPGHNFIAAFKHLLERAIIKYPSAMILIITPMRRYVYQPNEHGISISSIVDAELEVAKRYGIPVLDFFYSGGINPVLGVQKNAFTSDGLHPNQAGIDKFLAPRFSEFIKYHLSNRP